MPASNTKPTVIALSDNFTRLVVRGPGIDVEFRDGVIHVRTGSVQRADVASRAALLVGDVISNATEARNNGLVYAGFATDGRHLLVEREDVTAANGERLTMMFCEAATHAKARDMEVPSMTDLDILYKRAKAIGGFDFTPKSHYWSADGNIYGNAWAQRFFDGSQDVNRKTNAYYVRCVRRCTII